MADDKRPNAAPAGQAGGERSGRRYFWRKKRTQKGANETVDAKTQPAGSKQGAARPAAPERNDRSAPARRRRRPRSRQGGLPDPKVIVPVTPLDHDYVTPASIFIYTHVVRPDQRDSYEFRSEHFSKVSRTLEDFEIDLSKLFPEEGAEPAAVSAPQKVSEESFEDMDNFSYDEDEAEA